MLKIIMERRAALKAALEALNAKAVNEAGEARSFTAEETTEFDAGMAELATTDARIAELQNAESREAVAAAHRVATGTVETVVAMAHVNEPNPIYRRDNVDTSFFRDMFSAQVKGDTAARGRLAASQETRAGDLTTVAGAGGQFAPPLWLVDDFVALARAGRVTADLMNKQELPPGVSSINLPKVSGGTAVAVTNLQNTNVQDTAATTTSVTSGITTISGQQIVSLQLLQQSGIPFDRVILGDLARAYATQMDVQVLTGSGAAGQLRGLLNGAGVGATTFTTVSPAVTSATAANSFYNKLISAIATISTTRFLPPSCIIMHPVRWGWIAEGLDSTLRPLIPVGAPSYNAMGTADAYPVAQGSVGTVLGLPVYLDPNIPQNLGAGLNEDRVFVCRCDDLWLFESAVQSTSFDATYASQNSILYRVLGYSAFIPDRYGASVNVIAGTGMIVPAL